jgi:sporulation protein YlmC with PRC-barrel domain
VRLSELLGTKVTTVSGRSLGHVHDVRARWTDEGGLVVTGLLIGSIGALERLGVARPARRGGFVPWADVLESGPSAVIVRDPPS